MGCNTIEWGRGGGGTGNTPPCTENVLGVVTVSFVIVAANGLGWKNDCALVTANLIRQRRFTRCCKMTRFIQLCQTSEWLAVHLLLCPVLPPPSAWFPPVGARKCSDNSAAICTCAGRSHSYRRAGEEKRSIHEGRKTISTSVHAQHTADKQAVPFLGATIKKSPVRLVLREFDSCRVLCCANCNLAGVGGDASHWYCQSPCFPITIARTPTWLPDWQCYFRGNYYDSDYVNHSALCSALHQMAAARAARYFFFFPPSCVGWLFEVHSLFFTVEKLFKNSCPAPLQCYYLWAQ